MLEAVLPISNREPVRRNLERAELLLRSLDFFWRGGSPLRLMIMMPDEECELIYSTIVGFGSLNNLEICYIPESAISPVLSMAGSERGTAKQMLIKLAAHRFVRGEYYLTLDTDVLATRPFGLHDLVRAGRALTEWEMPTLLEWWHESAKVLRQSMSAGDLAVPRMHVTPLLFCRTISRALTEHLSRLYRRDWIAALLDNYTGEHPSIWTEYT